MSENLKKLLPHFGIIFLFWLLSVIYLYPSIEGKVLQQGDILHAIGVSHQSTIYHKKTGKYNCWSPQLFSGMPSYQVSETPKHNFIFHSIQKFVRNLGSRDISILFLYFVGFYLLALAFGFDKFISAIGALAYGLSSYNIIIIIAGHITKAFALGYMPMIIGGFYLIYEKAKYWQGSILAILSLGVSISLGHMQIIYYTLLLLGLFILFEFFYLLKDKKLRHFFIALGFTLGIFILSILPNIVSLWEAYEMSKYSIRGKSEIAQDTKNTGLDKDYALSWSYGIAESFSIFIPNIKGGASGQIGNDPNAMKAISPQYRDIIAQQNHYWGNQPFTSGPVYFGAIIVFLALFGMFIIKNRIKWWLITATILSIMLSWGKNFPILTDLFFYHFPYYNKFRTVSMILTVASLTVPILAIMAIKELLESKEKEEKDEKKKKNMLKTYFWIAYGFTGGLALLFFLFPGIFNFLSNQEKEYFNQLSQQSPQIAQQIQDFILQLTLARKAIFQADAIRSFLFISIAAGLILFYIKGWLKNKNALLGILIVLIFADMWSVDRRYLSADQYQNKRKVNAFFNPSIADKFLQKDTDPDFRVADLTTNPFTDARTSYFHKNIGGYHGAKLHRYQDIIDKYLGYEIQMLQKALSDTSVNIDDVLPNMQILNMLNTKYLIINHSIFPLLNKYAFGHAWFVKNYKFVNSPQKEIDALGKVNLATTAVIDKSKFPGKYPEISLKTELDSAWIRLIYYSPDTLKYEYYSPIDAFVVFSEIYYPKGWQAYIDKQKASLVRANYILRALSVPKGKHIITMVFRPKVCTIGSKIGSIGSWIVLLTIIIYLIFAIKNSLQTTKQEKTNMSHSNDEGIKPKETEKKKTKKKK